jgi:hypothetical protein
MREREDWQNLANTEGRKIHSAPFKKYIDTNQFPLHLSIHSSDTHGSSHEKYQQKDTASPNSQV